MTFKRLFRLLPLAIILLFQSCTSYRMTGPYIGKTSTIPLKGLQFKIDSIRYTQGISHNQSASGLLKSGIYNEATLKKAVKQRYPSLFAPDGIPLSVDITASRRAPFNILAFFGYLGTFSLIPYSEEEKVTCSIDVKLTDESMKASSNFTYIYDSLLSVYFPTGAFYAGTQKTDNQIGGMSNMDPNVARLPEVKDLVARQFCESLVRTLLTFDSAGLQKLKYENE